MNSPIIKKHQHKKSNLSSSEMPKNMDKIFTIEHIIQGTRLKFNDIVTIECSQEMVMTLVSPRNMVPGMVSNSDGNGRFCLFQFVPVSTLQDQSGRQVQVGESLYIRNKESGMYLATESEVLNEFTHLYFQAEKDERCLFRLQKEKIQGEIHSQDECMLKHVASGLFLRTQPVHNCKEQTLWLGEVGTHFSIEIANRSKQLPLLLNDRDIIVLTVEIKNQRYLLGVQKHLSFCNLLEKREPIGQVQANINMQYNSRSNCKVIEIPEDHTDGFFMTCLWEAIRPSYLGNKELAFVIREDQNLALRHVETGLFLCCRDRREFELREMSEIEGMIGFENIEHYTCDFEQSAHFQPIYIDHPLKIKQTDILCSITRIQSQTRLLLFMQEWLSLVSNIAKLLSDPTQIGEQWQTLQEQINFYVYVFRLLQKEIQSIGDGGFYFFQFSLRVLQVIRGMIQKGGEQIRRLLGGMLDEMIRFISLVVVSSEVLATITSEDVRKTEEIIYLLFVLYPLNRKYILAVVVCLSSADPQLVVSILGQQLIEAGQYQERVDILKAITDVIDRFRRINLDQEIFERMMSQEHQLQLTPSTLLITFKGQEHDMFDLLKTMEQLPYDKTEYEWQQHYEIVYLLKMMRLLYGAMSVTRQAQNKSKQSKRVHEDHINNISLELMTIFMNSKSVELWNIILEFLNEFVSQICQAQRLNFNHRFLIFPGELLTVTTELRTVLRMKKQGTLEWLIDRELFLDCLKDICRPGWQEGLDLMLVLRFLGRMVDLCQLILTTHTFDVGAINQIQLFGIAVSTLYYRNKVKEGYFLKNRTKICKYQEHRQLLVVEGVKTQLDILITKLSSLFSLILNFKQRLSVHPLLDNPQHTLQLSHFQKLYVRLSLNQRLKLQIPALSKLLSLNKQSQPISAIILSPQTIQLDCLKHVETAMADLQSLSIIMESFRLYSEKERLKQNMLATMKLKILNIEQAIRLGSKHKQFNKYCDALILPEALLSFILENGSQTELVQRLAQLLLDRVSTSGNLPELINNNRQAFQRALVQTKAGKCVKYMLKWIGQQIQKNTNIKVEQWHFLYDDIVKALGQDGQNYVVYYLISLLLELGITYPEGRQMLYSKLVRYSGVRDLLASCASSQTLKNYRDRIDRDAFTKHNMKLLSLELTLMFRLAEGQPKLIYHLQSLIPLRQIKDSLFNSDHYFFFRPFLVYLTCHSSIFQDMLLINDILIYGMRIISSHREYIDQLAKYHPRVGEKDKDNKSATHFDKKHSSKDQNNYLQVPGERQEQKKYYWQFLFWVPYYQEPQGLLVCLEKVLRKVVGNKGKSQNIVDSLNYLQDSLIELTRKKEVQCEQFRLIGQQIDLLLKLLSLRKEQDKVIEEGSDLDFGRSDNHVEEIYKILAESDMLKPVVGQITKELTVQQMNTSRSIKSSKSQKIQKSRAYLLPIQYQQQFLSQSINTHSIQQCTHHELIRPSRLAETHQPQRPTKPKLKQNRSKSIVNFLDRLKQLMRHRIRLNGKIEMLILRYFTNSGTFFGLYGALLEEVNTTRYKAITYKDDILDYQWNWRTVPAKVNCHLYKEHEESLIQRGQTTVNLETDHFLLGLQLHPTEALRSIYEVLHSKDPDSLSDVFMSEYPQFFRLIIAMLKSKETGREEVSLIIRNCDYIQELFFKHSQANEYLLKKKDSIQEAIAIHIQKMQDLPVNSENMQLFVRHNIFFFKIMISIVSNLDNVLTLENWKATLSRLPKKVFRYLMLQMIKMTLKKMIVDDTKPLEESAQIFLEQMQDNIQGLKEKNALELELSYEHMNTVFDYMLIKINKTNRGSFAFSVAFLRLIIQVQIIIYRHIQKPPHNSHEKLRQFQEKLIISSMSLFHMLFYQLNDKLDQSLFQQRQAYFENQINTAQLKAVYDYYEKHYEWCLIQLDQGKKVIQVFPKEKRTAAWKEQFKKIISSEAQINKKKEMIITYCLGMTPQFDQKQKLADKLIIIEPIALAMSVLCIGIGLIYRLALNMTGKSTIFDLLLLVHFLFISFVLFSRFNMIRIVGEISKILGIQQNVFCYVVKNGFGLILFSSMILGFTLVAFEVNGIAPLILWEIFLFRSASSKLIYNVAKLMGHSILLLLIILSTGSYLLAMTVNPVQGEFIYPVLNWTTNYDYSFTLSFLPSWTASLWNTYKGFQYVIFLQVAHSLVFVFCIYYFMMSSNNQNKLKTTCQLCSEFQNKVDQNYSKKHINFCHNIFKIISCFKHVMFLEEDMMSLQQKRIKRMIEDRNIEVFT